MSFLQTFANNYRILTQTRIQPPWGVNIGSPGDLLNRAMPILYSFVGVGLFSYFLYGGYLWLTSTGEPDKIKKGVDTMVNATIGTAIMILAYFATRVVGGILGITLF